MIRDFYVAEYFFQHGADGGRAVAFPETVGESADAGTASSEETLEYEVR